MAIFRQPSPSLSLPWTVGTETKEEDEASAAFDGRALLANQYAAHATKIHRFLRDLLRDPALAADATQETFVRAFRQIGTLRDRSRALPWLFGIARNVSLELSRARTRARRVIVEELDERGEERTADGALLAASPESELLGDEVLGVVESALVTLSEDRRAVLLLRLDHGLSYGEIAELMGWSLAKVKIEIFRGREVIRVALARYEGGAGEHE